MPIDSTERVPLGRTGLAITRLGFGGASIGGLFAQVTDEDAIGTVRHAWDLGVRSFDTAPLYGYGASERRVGAALRDRPRDAYVLSTKVGRLVRDEATIAPGTDIDPQVLDGRAAPHPFVVLMPHSHTVARCRTSARRDPTRDGRSRSRPRP